MIKVHFSVFGRLLGGASVLAAAAFVSGQTYWNGDPNIILPKSGVEVKGHFHTTYLIRKTAGSVPLSARQLLSEPMFGPHPQQEGGFGYTPDDIHAAYNIPTKVNNNFVGTGAIAIVDAYNLSTLQADFNAFAAQYNLPPQAGTITSPTNTVLQVVYASGTAPTNDDQGWGGEIALDMEWVHAMAPKAKIYLVLANSSSVSDLMTAVQKAASLPNVKEISMSFGGLEFPGESSYDINFQHAGIVYFASAGDAGGVQLYPSESPYVVGVGGTSLIASLSHGWISETAWMGSGGGPSAYEPKPSFQQGIAGVLGPNRGTPDISAVADPLTGVWVYSKGAFSSSNPWGVIGGTSLACPVCASITNDRGTWTHSTGREEERIYFNLGGPYYHDITGGSAGSFLAGPGWDYITGIGTPNGLFPPYVPPEVLQARTCKVFQDGSGNIANSQQTQILSAVANQDHVLYSVKSVNTSLGQTADIALNFVMDKPISAFVSVPMMIYGMAPAGVTLQVFGVDYNTTSPYYGKLIYTGYSTPAIGGFANLMFNLKSDFVQIGTGQVNLVVRAILPPHISTLPFTYYIDRISLNEVSVPPWDVNAPL